jgi:hypothetical protein
MDTHCNLFVLNVTDEDKKFSNVGTSSTMVSVNDSISFDFSSRSSTSKGSSSGSGSGVGSGKYQGPESQHFIFYMSHK